MQSSRALASARVSARHASARAGPSTGLASSSTGGGSSSSSSSRSLASSSLLDRRARTRQASDADKTADKSGGRSGREPGGFRPAPLDREALRQRRQLQQLQQQRERVTELRALTATYTAVEGGSPVRTTPALLGDDADAAAAYGAAGQDAEAAELDAASVVDTASDELIHCQDWLEGKAQLAEAAAADSQADGGREQAQEAAKRLVAGFAKGTLVVVDSSSYSGTAVVLDTVLLQTLSLRLLLISGAVVYEPMSSVTHVFSAHRLPEALALTTGHNDSIRLCTAQQHASRRAAIRLIREVTRAEGEVRGQVETLMAGAWDHFRAPAAPDERTLVASEDLARYVIDLDAAALLEREQAVLEGETPEGETPEGETAAAAQAALAHELWRSAGAWERREEILRFAVLRHLVARSDRWICESGRDPWNVRRWRARSLQEVTEMADVRAMIERQSPDMLSFVKKAQALIDHSRPALDAPPPERSEHPAPPRLVPADASLPSFSESDLVILRHIQASFFVSARQASPFLQTVPWILKRTQRYGEVFDEECTARFLVEVGVRCEWDNWAALGSPLEFVKGERRNESRVAADTEAASSRPKASPPAQASTTPALGPDELYPSDLVDHLRHDFGQLNVFVIDDPDAAELDDGVSVERCAEPGRVWVHTHIADPTTLLHPGHRLAQAALARASTAYLPEGNYPLLPDALTLDRFSLGGKGGVVDPVKGQEALSFSALLNLETGETLDYKVRAAIIRNVHVTSYQAVNTALDCCPADALWPIGPPPAQFAATAPRAFKPEWLDDVKLLQQVARVINQRRFRAGAITWSSPEYQTKVFPSPLPSLALGPTSTPAFSQGAPFVSYRVTPAGGASESQRIVASCMTLAGNVAGRFFHDRHIPTAYRFSPPAVSKTREGLEELLASRSAEDGTVSTFDMDRLGVVLQAGRVSLSPETHWAMGITAAEGGYVRVTSPLRRYGDIIAHWQIKHALLAEASSSAAAAAVAAPAPRSTELFTAAEVFKWNTSVELTSKFVRDASDRSKAFWGVYALQRHARQAATLDACAHNVHPPPFHYPFSRAPVPPTARLGPFTDAVIVQSNVRALQPPSRTVRVSIPGLGLQLEAHYPAGKVYGPGDPVSVLVDEFYLGPRPSMLGTIVA